MTIQMLKLNKLLTRTYREDEGDAVPVVPVAINPATIRNVTPRRDNAPGARLTFVDGGGYAVRESFAEVLRYIETGEVPEAFTAPVAQITDAVSGTA